MASASSPRGRRRTRRRAHAGLARAPSCGTCGSNETCRRVRTRSTRGGRGAERGGKRIVSGAIEKGIKNVTPRCDESRSAARVWGAKPDTRRSNNLGRIGLRESDPRGRSPALGKTLRELERPSRSARLFTALSASRVRRRHRHADALSVRASPSRCRSRPRRPRPPAPSFERARDRRRLFPAASARAKIRKIAARRTVAPRAVATPPREDAARNRESSGQESETRHGSILGPNDAPSPRCGARRAEVPYFGSPSDRAVLVNDAARDAIRGRRRDEFIALPEADDPNLVALKDAMQKRWQKCEPMGSGSASAWPELFDAGAGLMPSHHLRGRAQAPMTPSRSCPARAGYRTTTTLPPRTPLTARGITGRTRTSTG